jgi:hypothetical protein
VEESPLWRCAERIWRVNAGSGGMTGIPPEGFHVKLRKKNVFASRACGDFGLQMSTLRPGVNLLVEAGEAGTYVTPNATTDADIALNNLDIDETFVAFKNRDDFFNGSSAEVALQGLYGDYVLLNPKMKAWLQQYYGTTEVVSFYELAQFCGTMFNALKSHGLVNF